MWPFFASQQSSPAVRSHACISVLLISVAGIVGMPSAQVARAGDLIVRFDQSQLLRLPRPATEVIIGNPSIADVALQGGNLLVVTGKTFGLTNVIALDAERNVIQDQRVLVERDEHSMVNVHKGGDRYTYSCTPSCEPNLVPGDQAKHFDNVNMQNTTKMKTSESAADSGGSANAQ